MSKNPNFAQVVSGKKTSAFARVLVAILTAALIFSPTFGFGNFDKTEVAYADTLVTGNNSIVEVYYTGAGIDLSAVSTGVGPLFTVSPNTGTREYAILDQDPASPEVVRTGTGYIANDGKTLHVTSKGLFVVKLTVNGVSSTARLQVNMGWSQIEFNGYNTPIPYGANPADYFTATIKGSTDGSSTGVYQVGFGSTGALTYSYKAYGEPDGDYSPELFFATTKPGVGHYEARVDLASDNLWRGATSAPHDFYVVPAVPYIETGSQTVQWTGSAIRLEDLTELFEVPAALGARHYTIESSSIAGAGSITEIHTATIDANYLNVTKAATFQISIQTEPDAAGNYLAGGGHDTTALLTVTKGNLNVELQMEDIQIGGSANPSIKWNNPLSKPSDANISYQYRASNMAGDEMAWTNSPITWLGTHEIRATISGMALWNDRVLYGTYSAGKLPVTIVPATAAAVWTYDGTAPSLATLQTTDGEGHNRPLFTGIPEGVTAHYTIETGGTGLATVDADGNLNVTKAGTLIIGVYTDSNSQYAAGEKVTATLNVLKGTSTWLSGPGAVTVADWYWGQTPSTPKVVHKPASVSTSKITYRYKRETTTVWGAIGDTPLTVAVATPGDPDSPVLGYNIRASFAGDDLWKAAEWDSAAYDETFTIERAPLNIESTTYHLAKYNATYTEGTVSFDAIFDELFKISDYERTDGMIASKGDKTFTATNPVGSSYLNPQVSNEYFTFGEFSAASATFQIEVEIATSDSHQAATGIGILTVGKQTPELNISVSDLYYLQSVDSTWTEITGDWVKYISETTAEWTHVAATPGLPTSQFQIRYANRPLEWQDVAPALDYYVPYGTNRPDQVGQYVARITSVANGLWNAAYAYDEFDIFAAIPQITASAAVTTYEGVEIALDDLGLFGNLLGTGEKTYKVEASTGATGVGYVSSDGAHLVVTKAGTFKISLQTAANPSTGFGPSEKVYATLTVKKGNPMSGSRPFEVYLAGWHAPNQGQGMEVVSGQALDEGRGMNDVDFSYQITPAGAVTSWLLEKPTTPGDYVVRAHISANDLWLEGFAYCDFEVLPAPLDILPNDMELTYHGENAINIASLFILPSALVSIPLDHKHYTITEYPQYGETSEIIMSSEGYYFYPEAAGEYTIKLKTDVYNGYDTDEETATLTIYKGTVQGFVVTVTPKDNEPLTVSKVCWEEDLHQTALADAEIEYALSPAPDNLAWTPWGEDGPTVDGYYKARATIYNDSHLWNTQTAVSNVFQIGEGGSGVIISPLAGVTKSDVNTVDLSTVYDLFYVTPDSQGARTYTIVDGGSGNGYIDSDGKTLHVIKKGTFYLSLKIAKNEAYEESISQGYAVLTIDRVAVTVESGNVAQVYSSSALDLSGVAGLFVVNPSAATGAKTYSIQSGGTGAGIIGSDGKTLNITKAGTFNINLSVAADAANGYAAGASTTYATLNITKAPISIVPKIYTLDWQDVKNQTYIDLNALEANLFTISPATSGTRKYTLSEGDGTIYGNTSLYLNGPGTYKLKLEIAEDDVHLAGQSATYATLVISDGTSANAKLASLNALVNGSPLVISPALSDSITNYSAAVVAGGNPTVTIVATAKDGGSVIINGEEDSTVFPLYAGANVFDIEVISANGATTENYTLSITRTTLESGWTYSNGYWHYSENGALLTDVWKYLTGPDGSKAAWRYFTTEGNLAGGWTNVRGVTCYFWWSGNGASRANGLSTIEGKQYYFSSYELKTGWVYVNSTWRYFDDETGAAAVGWKTIVRNSGTYTYYFWSNGTGKYATGLQKYLCGPDGTWGAYYFDKSGHLQTGFVYVNSTWCYFDDATGVAPKGWTTIERNGVESVYYFYWSGYGTYVKNQIYTVDGVSYAFDSAGRCLNPPSTI